MCGVEQLPHEWARGNLNLHRMKISQESLLSLQMLQSEMCGVNTSQVELAEKIFSALALRKCRYFLTYSHMENAQNNNMSTDRIWGDTTYSW